MALKLLTKPPAATTTVQTATAVAEPMHIPAVVAPAETEIQTLTTQYIELWRKYQYFEVKQMVATMDLLRKQLVDVANTTMDPAKPALFVCDIGEMEFSERGKVTDVPDPLRLVQELLTKFGPEATAAVVSIALTPLRKLLSEAELKPHLVELPGHRTLRAVRSL